MLSMYLIPALIGLGLIVVLNDDDDDDTEGTPEDLETIREPDGSDIFEGTDDAERMIGNETTSEILGFGGNDVILGNGGGDAIDGGAGDDTIYGGTGNDFAVGNDGNDRVFLGDGNDEYLPDVDGSYDAGDDFVRGGAGNDFIGDLLGSNEIYGDTGSDTLVAFDSLDENGVYTDPAEQGTTDTLNGGYGNDIIAGDLGDILTGGQGADTFVTLDDEDPALENVNITDFDPEEDELVIATLFGLAEDTAIGLTYDSELEAVRATYEGRTVAIMQGLVEADIANINVSVTPFDAL